VDGLHGRDGRPFIDHLDAATAGELRKLGQWRAFRAGQVLTRHGEPGKEALLVDSGIVKVTVTSPAGDEVVLGFRGRGELLGEVSALRGTTRSATVTGHQPGGVIEIAAPVFRRFIWLRPELFAVLLNAASQRLRQSDLHRLSYASDNVSRRVASTLLVWAHDHGRITEVGTEITLRASRRELAQWVIASEKTVDSVLADLTRAGLIRTGRRQFIVLDAAGLHRWVHDRERPR
jgi:CRP-like cAMP-binding protein